MKKLILPCMLVFSLMTATATQLSTNRLNNTLVIEASKIPSIEFVEIAIEEEDEAFDFNTEDYLPLGFDATMTFEEKYGIMYETNFEETHETFDFNTEEYLPVGFNLNEDILSSIVEIIVEEEDEAFDFDTKKYSIVGYDS